MPDSLEINHHRIGIYIHWPFCLAKCPYCDFNSHVAQSIDYAAWQQALLAEMSYMADKAEQMKGCPARQMQVGSLFFGGGTPSLMPASLIEALIDKAASLFSLSADTEITVEANPTSVETEKFKGFAHAGVNRISVGIQSLTQSGLRFLGREHNVEQALTALDTAKSCFSSVSADLIYGLPDQTAADWQKQLEQIARFDLEHLSCYHLTIEPGTIFHTRAKRGEILTASSDHVGDLYLLTEAQNAAAGLAAYEISNYAKPGAASVHNLNYWQAGDWLAIGPGGHGRISTDDGRYWTVNRRSPAGWLGDVQKLGHGCEGDGMETHRDNFDEYWMMGLRLIAGINLVPPALFGGGHFQLDSIWRDQFIEAGWLKLDAGRIAATLEGRLRLDFMLGKLLG